MCASGLCTHFLSKLQVPMEHSGAISWSLKEDTEDAANRLVSCAGHLKPKEENTDTTCEPTATNRPLVIIGTLAATVAARHEC